MSLIEPKRYRFGSSSSSFFNEFQNLNKIKKEKSLQAQNLQPTYTYIYLYICENKSRKRKMKELTTLPRAMQLRKVEALLEEEPEEHEVSSTSSSTSKVEACCIDFNS